MYIKKENAKKLQFTDNCVVHEYDLGRKELGIATAHINGRFPNSGKSLNKVCDEVYYVVSGSGVAHLESGDFNLAEGDALFIPKGEWFWVEGNDLFIVIPTAPDWYEEQHIMLEE